METSYNSIHVEADLWLQVASRRPKTMNHDTSIHKPPLMNPPIHSKRLETRTFFIAPSRSPKSISAYRRTQNFTPLVIHPVWFSGFLDFDMPGGLANQRFATAQDKDSQERRGRLMAELLDANSRLILDSLVCDNGQWSFEPNNHDLNQLFGLAAQSALHMVVNPWSLNDSTPLPIYIRFKETYFARL